jgi:peptide/nickel transport system ATP-binding protein
MNAPRRIVPGPGDGPAQSGLPAVTVDRLSVTLADGAATVVQDVSFALQPGEILGLVGESGSGKTTVGLAVLGYARRGLRIAAGRVTVAGEDILARDETARRALRRRLVAYVPQDPATALNPTLKLRTQLAEAFGQESFGRKSFGQKSFGQGGRVDERDLLAALAEVKLPATPGFLDAYPHQLSGGQQQRVAIAMAFAHRPRVIVMDEPTTGLDVTTQAHVLETVRELCASHGVAAIYVSHDLAVVGALATRVAVMYAGRLVEQGAAEQVLRRPRHPYTRALLQAVPDLDGKAAIHGIAGHAPDPQHRPAGCAFAPRCALVSDACRAQQPPESVSDATHRVLCFHADAAGPATQQPLRSAPLDSAGQPVLALRNLEAWHGERRILHGVSLSLRAGTCLALVGESGSGKTTLSRSLAGLHHQVAGEIVWHGSPVAAAARARPEAIRRRIQYIFQNPYASLNPRRRIGETLAVAVRQFETVERARLRDRIAAALAGVALPERLAEAYPHQLSGGQRQRAAIARALIVEPELLICDEVTSALDVSVQAVVVELLATLQRERGLGLLFVTHNLALVRNIAQEVAVLQAGHLVEHGPVEDVLARPQAEETRRLLRDAPHFHASRPAA